MTIEYNHVNSVHTVTGPKKAIPILFRNYKPSSLLDVGCCAGTWLRAALDFGVADVFGVDGVLVAAEQLHVSPKLSASKI